MDHAHRPSDMPGPAQTPLDDPTRQAAHGDAAGYEAVAGPVDLQVIAILRGIESDEEPQFFAELVDAFLADLEERLRALQAAAAAGDGERLRSVGHTLKGSAGNLGATRLSGLAGQIEMAGRADAPAEIESLLSQLESEARRVRAFFLAERDGPR